eukprot:CAMPEP_0167803348 /NCGR_PEP_ID=MMETSP0111_2-20121227/19752_1 /TAXON_ID=91324 /ORGANISM="Lotharella globosa, Strain CCCM811" /LENGTH=243 /DNA_ID=CAMNT_0007699739 /DNA_START=452 /DNA_END=1181 /DNA_ORIENTATION=-
MSVGTVRWMGGVRRAGARAYAVAIDTVAAVAVDFFPPELADVEPRAGLRPGGASDDEPRKLHLERAHPLQPESLVHGLLRLVEQYVRLVAQPVHHLHQLALLALLDHLELEHLLLEVLLQALGLDLELAGARLQGLDLRGVGGRGAQALHLGQARVDLVLHRLEPLHGLPAYVLDGLPGVAAVHLEVLLVALDVLDRLLQVATRLVELVHPGSQLDDGLLQLAALLEVGVDLGVDVLDRRLHA